MKRTTLAAIAAITAIAAACGPTPVATAQQPAQQPALKPADGAWSCGVASVKITPDSYMWMSGYGGRDQPADGKITELWAKALVLDDGAGGRVALITLDLVGIGRELSQRICRSLESQHGLRRGQIALCTSHTHTGPVVGLNLGPLHYWTLDERQRELIDRYADQLHDKVVSLVGGALKTLAPCRASWASGKAEFAVNRRNNREAEIEQVRAAGELKGPVDHDVPVLALKDEAGKLRAVVFGYACHSTVLSLNQWSGDYPGFAQMLLEERHPGCTAMFWAGCGADQNPLPRRTVELARKYGGMLADAVDRTLDKLDPLAGRIESVYAEVPLPLDTLPSREEIEQNAKSKNKFEVARARMLLRQLDAGQPLSPTYPYPIATWRLGGDIEWVFLGGEVVVDFALRLKSELSQARTWVAGYSNDVMAYVASRRVLREGGYEGGGAMVYYGLPTAWAPESEEVIVREVKRQRTPNARPPANDGAMKSWLENMIWGHRFSVAEVQAATGLSPREIADAQQRWNIRLDNRPPLPADGPLRVLPYPGGRHPRIGFLEGAVDPQRETKISVFTPWDPDSYVVADIPEAIWSQLGLTYLAHTHVPTLWSRQQLDLPPLEWRRPADGGLHVERTLPNGIAFGTTVRPRSDAVRMEMWLHNGSQQTLTGLRVQNCVMLKGAAGFQRLDNDNKRLHNPYVACQSEDGRRWIISAWTPCQRPWANPRVPCLHSDPQFPDCPPGETRRLQGWLSFYEGDDLDAELARIEATNWRSEPLSLTQSSSGS